MTKFPLLLFCSIASVLSVELPKTITPCHTKDPEVSKCMKKAMYDSIKTFKNGDKQFKIPAIDPLLLPELKLVQTKPNTNFGLSLTYRDTYMKGLEHMEFKNIDVKEDGDKLTLKLETFFPSVIMEGNYEMNGKLLLFTLQGKDKFRQELINVPGVTDIELVAEEKDGVKHYLVKNTQFTIGRFKFTGLQYDNLIKGNPKLSKDVNKVLAESAESLRDLFAPSINEFFSGLVKDSTSGIFSQLPLDVVLPP